MKTIFYLIDLHEGKMVESYEGKDDEPPEKAIKDAEARAEKIGHTCTLARGKLFFQKDGSFRR